MFSRLQPRKSIPLSREQIVKDVESIDNREEQRSKLFECLDQKVPQGSRCVEMEAFLRGTEKLEEIQRQLHQQIGSLQALSEKLLSGMEEIEGKMKACQ